MNKACFTCHKEVKDNEYGVHPASGAICCSPLCMVVHNEALDKALVEEVIARSVYVGED
jgi:hypothetical protein